MEADNTKAMREALEYVKQWREDCISEEGADLVDEMIAVVDAALAKPPRNCDVGTHEEQWSRFEKMCFSNRQPDDPDYCSCKCKVNGGCVNDCALKWAQMPYEKGDAHGNPH